MNYFKKGLLAFVALGFLIACHPEAKQMNKVNSGNMIVRIAEIEIEPGHRDAYLAILKEGAAISVASEPGVISIYPMFRKDSQSSIRILEIYASKEAYESHLQTDHFKYYKSATMKMIRSLELVDMESIDKETMSKIFKKCSFE